MTIVTNTVFCNWNVKRPELVLPTMTNKINMWGDEYVNN